MPPSPPTQPIYDFLLYYYKKEFGEALGIVRSVFPFTVASIPRLFMGAQGHPDKCNSIAKFFYSS